MKNAKTIVSLVVWIIIIGLSALYLLGCSVAVPLKGTARVDTSGKQTVTVSGEATENVNVNLNIDIASQINEICKTATFQDDCRQQVLSIYQALTSAVAAAKLNAATEANTPGGAK